jgi:hypothetical protein
VVIFMNNDEYIIDDCRLWVRVPEFVREFASFSLLVFFLLDQSASASILFSSQKEGQRCIYSILLYSEGLAHPYNDTEGTT